MRFLRLLRILVIALRFGLDDILLSHARLKILRPLTLLIPFRSRLKLPRAVRLRLALEKLGPIFIKFGQMLSTRRDLLAQDFADELAKLQDQVPPFPSDLAIATLERVYEKPISEVFLQFERQPVASASVAQVHLAVLHNGTEVAVKILRPAIAPVIAHDVALMESAAWLLESIWPDGKRLKLREVVSEFARHLEDELDLVREASNCSQLRRNFLDSPLLFVPEVYWDYCYPEVMVMERVKGIPISHVDTLREHNIDIPQLARMGVEIFFTQVFRDGYFHADMHPGNIFVGSDGRYIAVDFGIMGSLSDEDKNYLAQNFLGFFQRETIGALHKLMSMQGGHLEILEWMTSKQLFARFVNQSLTNPSRKFILEEFYCACFKPLANLTSKFNLNWFYCKKRFLISKVWEEI